MSSQHTPAGAPAPDPVVSATAAPPALVAAALAQLSEGVIVTDASGRIQLVNDAAARLHGVARLGVGVDEYATAYRLFTEDGHPYPSTELPLARAVLRGETVVDARWRIRRPDGSEILAAGSARPVLGPAGERLGAVLTIRDDTPRADAIRAEKAAERERERLLRALDVERSRLAAVFAQSPSILAMVRGPRHVLELANDAYLNLIGRRDIIGKPLLEAVTELQGQGFEKLLDAVVETGEPFVGREVPTLVSPAPGAPPEERFFDFVYLPLTEVDGTRSGVIAHGSDVTEQVRARRDVERLLHESEGARAEADEARAEAEAANRAKSEFLAMMSHELRTPLNAIGGYAELMEMGIRGPVTPQQVEDLRRLQASQRHLLGLVNEVLNYARIETGTVRYDIADVHLAAVVASVEPLVAPQLAMKGLDFAILPCTPGLVARADREKVRQVLLNLLSNAIKFTDSGGRVEVSCEAAGDRALMRVRDTGIGIAAAEFGRIFEPFVQVNSSLTRTHEGTGLGLAISRDLARGMGGELTVESRPGVGSTFTLVLKRV